MLDIEVNENGIPYECGVDEYDIFKYIKENENDLRHLNDEQKILKSVYELWLEDKNSLKIFEIPEISPYYGERFYEIENITLDNIRWIDDMKPSDVLRKQELESECVKVLKESLEVEVLFVDSNIGGNFCIGIDESMLYFDNKNFDFVYGSFHGKYRLKKNRPEIIKKAQEAICKNIDLIRNYCSFSGGKGSN